ncbi:MAG: autotransporter-associated beta strand repeat-containing protein, partial [Fibrobacterota bacterium]
MTLSGNNTFSGGYTHVAGDVELGHSNALGTGTATTTSSGRIFLMNGVSIGNTLTISTCNAGVGHSVVNSDTGANATWSGTINVNTLCTTGGHLGGAEDLSGSLTVSGAINMGGTATWVQQRDGVVIYSGGGNATRFDLLKGTARLGATNGLPSTARFSQSHAGYVSALDLYGYSQTFQGIAAPANANATLTNSQAGLSTLTLTGSVDTTYSGNITGNLALVKSGTYVQTLGGTNTYTGATTISQGTLKMGGASALSSATSLSVTGTLDLNGYSESVGSITGAGTIDNTSSNAGTYTLATGGDNTSTTFSG